MKKYTYLLLPFCMLATACRPSADAKLQEPVPQERPQSDPVAEEPIDWKETFEVVDGRVLLNGTLAIPPQNYASATLIMGGTVHKIHVQAGSYVNKGAVLATLKNTEFIDLQQQYLESHAQTEYLHTEYNRQKVLSEQEAGTKKRFEESKAEYLSMKSKKNASEARLRLLGISPEIILSEGINECLTVKAPISGYIAGMKMNVGKYISAGEPLCEIIDKNNMWLNLIAYEKDLEHIATGQKTEFSVNGMEGLTFTATIFSIGQEVDVATRSLEVLALVEGKHERFRPGMYVTAQIDKK